MGLLLLVMAGFLYFVFLMVFVTNAADRSDRSTMEVNSTPTGHSVNLKVLPILPCTRAVLLVLPLHPFVTAILPQYPFCQLLPLLCASPASCIPVCRSRTILR